MNNGKVVAVKRSSLKDLQTLIDLQESLLAKYIDQGGEGFAQLMLDEEFTSELAAFINLIPLADGLGNLVFEEMNEDWEQLQQLVFNGNYTVDTQAVMNLTPSLFSKLNFLPFSKVALPLIQSWIKSQKQIAVDLEKDLEELNSLNTAI